MNEIDATLIKKNVKLICDEQGLTQTELAGIIDTSQSYLSKLLNPKGKACFNLQQLYKISQKFNVSMDQLVGIHTYNTQPSANNVRQICDFLANLIRDGYLSINLAEIEEDNAYVSETDDYGEDTGIYYKKTQKQNYLTLYFSNYHRLNTRFDSKDYYEEEQAILRDCGNDHGINRKINSFLSTYTQLYNLYQIGQLSSEAFKDMEAALINNVI